MQRVEANDSEHNQWVQYWNTPLNDNTSLLYLFMDHLTNEKEQQAFEDLESWLPIHYQGRVLKCIEMLNLY